MAWVVKMETFTYALGKGDVGVPMWVWPRIIPQVWMLIGESPPVEPVSR
jgi:hypothetical protein